MLCAANIFLKETNYLTLKKEKEKTSMSKWILLGPISHIFFRKLYFLLMNFTIYLKTILRYTLMTC